MEVTLKRQPYSPPKPKVCDKSQSGQHRFVGYPRDKAACSYCGKKREE